MQISQFPTKCHVEKLEDLSKGGHRLGSKTKKIPKSSDPIGQEQTFGPTEFTPQSKLKRRKNKMTLT